METNYSLMKMYNHLLTVFPLLLLFTIPGECIINIEVWLDSYSLNPLSRHSCANVSGLCSNVFHFCLRPRNRFGDCRYGEVTTNVVTTNESFSFTPEVLSELGIMNPLVFSHFTPQGEVKLDITVSEHGQFLDTMSVTFFETETITTQYSRTSSFIGSAGRAFIRLSYRITSNCSIDTYGPTCDTICRSSGTYYCNYLGVRVCDTGYYPPGDCSQYCSSSSCSGSSGGFPFLAIAVTIPIGILLLMGIVACVCCICVCNKDGIHTSDFLSKKDCDCNKCFKSNENFCRCLGGLLLWILLLPISLPYSIISSFWNGVWDAEEGDRMYCNPFPCC